MRKGVWLIGVALLLAACSDVTEVTPEADPAGTNEIVAHRGDLEARPEGWLKTEWDNSVQALGGAIDKGARWIEIDLQLNLSADATAQNPNGILYVHHETTCDVIDQNGQKTGESYNIETGAPADVDKCAERLTNVLNAYPTGKFVLEMKSTSRNKDNLAQALYSLLEAKGQRTTEIVSSLNESRLTDIKALADTDGVTMNLMRVYPYGELLVGGAEIERAQENGFQWVAVYTDSFVGDTVSRAKELGVNIGGWHWSGFNENTPNVPYLVSTCDDATRWAVDNDLDFMMIDCISQLDAKEGWD